MTELQEHIIYLQIRSKNGVKKASKGTLHSCADLLFTAVKQQTHSSPLCQHSSGNFIQPRQHGSLRHGAALLQFLKHFIQLGQLHTAVLSAARSKTPVFLHSSASMLVSLSSPLIPYASNSLLCSHLSQVRYFPYTKLHVICFALARVVTLPQDHQTPVPFCGEVSQALSKAAVCRGPLPDEPQNMNNCVTHFSKGRTWNTRQRKIFLALAISPKFLLLQEVESVLSVSYSGKNGPSIQLSFLMDKANWQSTAVCIHVRTTSRPVPTWSACNPSPISASSDRGIEPSPKFLAKTGGRIAEGSYWYKSLTYKSLPLAWEGSLMRGRGYGVIGENLYLAKAQAVFGETSRSCG